MPSSPKLPRVVRVPPAMAVALEVAAELERERNAKCEERWPNGTRMPRERSAKRKPTHA